MERKVRYLCSNCKREFYSLTSFDKHRIGSGTQRRCMSTSEIAQMFHLDKQGRYRQAGTGYMKST